MSNVDFGDPVYVDELPPGGKSGRKSVSPALATWLAKIEPGKTAELPSTDPDVPGHPVSRVTQIRKVAGDAFAIETRTLEPGKRYRIFATIATPKANGDKAKAPAPAKA